MEKVLPIQEKTVNSEEIDKFLRNMISGFEDASLTSADLIIENENENTKEVIKTIKETSTTKFDTLDSFDTETPKQKETSTDDSLPIGKNIKKFINDVFFGSINMDGVGKMLWEKMEEGKQKSIVKSTPDEVKEKRKLDKESTPIITKELKEESKEQTTLLDKIHKTTIVDDETRYEEAIKWEREISLLEEIRDALLSGVSSITEKSSSSDTEKSSSSSGGLLSGIMSGLMGGLLVSVIGPIKKGLITAFKFIFSPKNMLRAITRFIAPAMIIATIAKGLFDGIKEFQESGSIKEALISGLGGMLEFLTFGLFDKETIRSGIDFLSTLIDDYVKEPFNSFMEWIGESFNTYIKEPLLGAFDWYVGNIKKFILDPIMSVFDTFSDIIGKIVKNVTDFLHNIEIPGISFSVLGKKFSVGPWYPFAPDEEKTVMEDGFPEAIDTRSGKEEGPGKAFTSEIPLTKDHMDGLTERANAPITFSDSPSYGRDSDVTTIRHNLARKYGKNGEPIIVRNGTDVYFGNPRVFHKEATEEYNALLEQLDNPKAKRPTPMYLEPDIKTPTPLTEKEFEEELKRMKVPISGSTTQEQTIEDRLAKIDSVVEPTSPPPVVAKEVAAEIGKHITVNVPPAAAPQKEILAPPFSQRIKNNDSTVGRYIDRGYSTV